MIKKDWNKIQLSKHSILLFSDIFHKQWCIKEIVSSSNHAERKTNRNIVINEIFMNFLYNFADMMLIKTNRNKLAFLDENNNIAIKCNSLYNFQEKWMFFILYISSTCISLVGIKWFLLRSRFDRFVFICS
jgi:hypothetical protein